MFVPKRVYCGKRYKVKWYRGRNLMSFVFTTGSCRTKDFLSCETNSRTMLTLGEKERILRRMKHEEV